MLQLMQAPTSTGLGYPDLLVEFKIILHEDFDIPEK